MSRRLLLVLAGLGGAAAAVMLWSGGAYASTRTPPVPRLPGALGAPPAPVRHDPLPHPSVPLPPVPGTVQPGVAALPPVVAHTLTRVRAAVPPVAAILPAPHTPSAHARVLPARPVAGPVRTHELAAAHRRHAAPDGARKNVARRARSHARVPAGAVHHRGADAAPLGVADGSTESTGSTHSASGSPFAVTARTNCHTPDGWWHAAVVDALEPAMVGRRDIARPG